VSFITYKNEGETPLDALERLRREKGIAQEESMTYAGRLDPMAEGLLLILVGEECKNKTEYLGLDKEYEVEVLLGVGSDTGDILGMVDCDAFDGEGNMKVSKDMIQGSIQEKIQLLIGKRSEKYPAYSSRTVNGRPLFVHTREGGLGDIEIPEKEIEIYSIDFISLEEIETKTVIETAIERIAKVKGDFRQNDVVRSWNLLKDKLGDDKVGDVKTHNSFLVVSLRVRSSSGAYMRTLAEKLGASLGVKSIAWKIKRTKIGGY
jgi:tRNA pseudouridine(55) synthase